eukprot:6146455-Prymnesium_polylepis.2
MHAVPTLPLASTHAQLYSPRPPAPLFFAVRRRRCARRSRTSPSPRTRPSGCATPSTASAPSMRPPPPSAAER